MDRADKEPRRTWGDVDRTSWALVAVALAVVAAGCTTGPDTPEPSVPVLDGDAAHAFVGRLVTAADGSPAFRVPGTPAHAEAAQRLRDAMQVTGWSVEWQNFTGLEYAALDKGAVRTYHDSPAYCDADERDRLDGLAFHNLVATRRGSEAGRTFMLAAHWDSKRFASSDPDAGKRMQPVLGANDGASGVGVLLQLMRELDGVTLPFDVQVILFDGEDGFEDCHPLAGSLWFVHTWQEDRATAGVRAPPSMGGGHDRLLLLDMVGDPDARFIREGHSVRCDEGLVDLLHRKAAAHGLADNFVGGAGQDIHDDHVPFTQAGIPAVDLIDFGRGFPPYWHTTHDTLDKVDAAMLGRVGGLVLDVMADPGLSGPWPSGCP